MGNSLGKIVDKQTVLTTPFNQNVNDAIFYGLGFNNLNDRGDFVLNGAYAVNDFVIYPGYSNAASQIYVCILAINPATLAPNADTVHWKVYGLAITTPYPYDIGLFFPGQPLASQLILRYVASRPLTGAVNLAGSDGSAVTAATASTMFVIAKNGASIGTMIFSAAGTISTFAVALPLSLGTGDILTITAPASPDTTLANISVTLTLSR